MTQRGLPRRALARIVMLLAAVAIGAAASVQAQSTPEPATPAPSPNPASDSDALAEGGTSDGSDSLNAALARLAKQQFDIERALASTRLDVASAKRRFEAAEQRLDADPDASQALRDEVAARRVDYETEERIAALLEDRSERREDQEQTWRRLYALSTDSVPPETLTDWLSASEAATEELSREASVKDARFEEVHRDLEFTAEQADEASAEAPDTRWVGLRKRSLRSLLDAYETDIQSIEEALALEEKLADRLAAAQDELSFVARLRVTAHTLREVWNYKLTGSEPEPITLGKIVSALFIFMIGWLAARMIASLLGSRVFPRLRLEEGAAAAFESLAFYVLMLVAFLTALRMVQIPLTAFAVAGGALAIGVGFGSQNVVNNFISGIILLVERPIKRSDLVEVEGVFGNVEQIGLRSTRVRTGDNVHIIVPNAAFLESKVINWTHSDARVRITISVGVAYGSPTREVERLIREAVLEHPAILNAPEPIVIFTEFGDNALGFETRFWIEMRTVIARLRIESDVRFRIDELFREAGITIAFPQRDVHLDSLKPVEIRLVPPEPEESDDDREA